MARIIQITDLHLFEDPEGLLRGVPMVAALEEMLAFIRRHHADFDRLVITGDLAHDEKRTTYEMLRETIVEWIGCCRMIPGNHDNRGFMRAVFPEVIPSENGAVCFSESLDGWRLIGLDTHVPGEVYGRIDPEHLDWLQAELKASAAEPVVLFMHHPPILVNSRWIDDIGLMDREAIASVVASADNIRAIFTGHLHREFEGLLHEVPVRCTPSVAIQFTPGTEELQRDFVPPGLRIIELEGNLLKTRVVRLPELQYPPEP